MHYRSILSKSVGENNCTFAEKKIKNETTGLFSAAALEWDKYRFLFSTLTHCTSSTMRLQRTDLIYSNYHWIVPTYKNSPTIWHLLIKNSSRGLWWDAREMKEDVREDDFKRIGNAKKQHAVQKKNHQTFTRIVKTSFPTCIPVAVLLDLPQLQLVLIDPLHGYLRLGTLRRFRTLPFPQPAPYRCYFCNVFQKFD